eukprot:986537-Pelagomonas_calceolata.AAC.3
MMELTLLIYMQETYGGSTRHDTFSCQRKTDQSDLVRKYLSQALCKCIVLTLPTPAYAALVRFVLKAQSFPRVQPKRADAQNSKPSGRI